MSHVYKPSVSADFGPDCYIREAENGPNYNSLEGSNSADIGPNPNYYEGVVVSKGYSPSPISYRGCVSAENEPSRDSTEGEVAPRLSAVEAPTVYTVGAIDSVDFAQFGPDSLVTEAVGCHSEAADSYGYSKTDQYWYPFDLKGETRPRG